MNDKWLSKRSSNVQLCSSAHYSAPFFSGTERERISVRHPSGKVPQAFCQVQQTRCLLRHPMSNSIISPSHTVSLLTGHNALRTVYYLDNIPYCLVSHELQLSVLHLSPFLSKLILKRVLFFIVFFSSSQCYKPAGLLSSLRLLLSLWHSATFLHHTQNQYLVFWIYSKIPGKLISQDEVLYCIAAPVSSSRLMRIA